ncbi:MAG: hypothetical protein GC137_09655 [Alphaproteobacteria bacterium]|nr:hypothetical protein [Alphaproteobacteria bacterium]
MPSLDTLIKYHHFSLFFLTTLISTLWVVMLNHEEFSASETRVFCLYIAAVTVLQLGVLGLFKLFANILPKSSWIVGIVATLLTTFNLYTLIIVHNSRFPNLEPPLFAAFIGGLTFCVALMFFIRHKIFVKFVHVFCCIMAVMIGLQSFGNGSIDLEGLLDRMPEHFEEVEFKQKPNVYVISLDALVPEAVAKNNIAVETVPYIDALIEENARFIPNSFAERIPTKRSMNLVLAMDKNYFDTVSEDAGFIRDQVPNPTYETFRRNGYKIQFMYGSSYFGDDRGRLDYFGIAKAYGLCKHVERKYGFMGYCLDEVQEHAKQYTKIREDKYPQMLFDRIKETASSGEPWFTYASIYEPGHAKNSTQYNKLEDWEQYKRHFEKSSADVVETIKTLMKTIRDNDPNAITIIFGDHGSLLTLGALGDQDGLVEDALAFTADDLPKDSPVSFKQVVQDRHGILIAVMPAEACSSEFVQNPYSNMRMMRDLIKCLSDGTDPLPEDFQPDDSRWAPYKYE